MAIASEVVVDADALRAEVKSKYREVATDPHAGFHFHTGRYLAKHLGYDDEFVGSLPDEAVESFAGVATSGLVRDSIHSSPPTKLDRPVKSSALI
jgi:arsenite methyltransferase